MLINLLRNTIHTAIQYNGTNHLEIEHLTNREILFDIDSQLLLRAKDNMPVNIGEWVLRFIWKNIYRYWILSNEDVKDLFYETDISEDKILPHHFSNEYSGNLKLNATQAHILEVVKQTITKADERNCEGQILQHTHRPLGRTLLSHGVRAVMHVTITTHPEDVNDIIEKHRKAGIELFDIKATDLNNDFTTVNGIESTHSDSELRSEIAELNKRLQNIKTLFRVNGDVLSEEQERFWSPDNWANLQIRDYPEFVIHQVSIIPSDIFEPEGKDINRRPVRVVFTKGKEGIREGMEYHLSGRNTSFNIIDSPWDIVERKQGRKA